MPVPRTSRHHHGFSSAALAVALMLASATSPGAEDPDPTEVSEDVAGSFSERFSSEGVVPTFMRPDIAALFSAIPPPLEDEAAATAAAIATSPELAPARPDETAAAGSKNPVELIKELLVPSAESAASPAPPAATAAASDPAPSQPPAPPIAAAAAPDAVPSQPPAATAAAPEPPPAPPAPSTMMAAAPVPAPSLPASPPGGSAAQPAPGAPAVAAAAPTPTRVAVASDKRRTAKAKTARGRRLAAGRATFYKHPGRTASGEKFHPDRLTAAHKTLPLGSRVRVVNRQNGRAVTVRINDRVPRRARVAIDLSRGSARRIGITEKTGVAPVVIYSAN
jgi:rare lipoprotein A